MYSFTFLWLLQAGLLWCAHASLPVEVRKCNAGDTTCIKGAISGILQRYPKGNKEFGLLPVDELKIDSLNIVTSPGNPQFELELSLNKLEIYGIEKAIVERVVGFEKYVNHSKFEVHAVLPEVDIKSKYNAKGKIMVIPIQGSGDIKIHLTKVKIGIRCKAVEHLRSGRIYAKLIKFEATLQPDSMKVQVDNLFEGNEDLTTSVNKVINENWKEIWQELKEGISKSVGDSIRKIMENVLQFLPYDDFYAN